MDVPFRAFFPKAPKIHDEIVIKGKFKNDAKKFSINLCLELPQCHPLNKSPPYIGYHFKTRFDVKPQQVIHNYKNVRWGQELAEDNTWCNGPGTDFEVTFMFGEHDIKIYSGDNPRNFEYAYEPHFDISEFKMLEIWDDLDKLHEIVFRYSDDNDDF